ncbi:uncharacterized protein LOC116350325 isoform X2 [Contarinia nasturtii]|nr:uncharacterized protein LOC116350325 isoform X2 [Contarinia nasturtii]
MDGIAENGNSVAGHSHFQPIATATPTAAAAETALIMNGDDGSIPSTVLPVSPQFNSVSPDAMTQRLDVVEVGSTQPSPQPMTRKSLEMKDKFMLHTTNQFHSRHDSEQISSSSSIENINNVQSGTSFSLVSDRKQQLEQIGKCAKLNQSFDSVTTKQLQPPQQSPVLQKFLKTSEKRSSVPNWFPSKRNSLALLADQQLESAANKRNGGKMVAMQELATATNNSTPTFDDNSEELQYGPGIVSKLRCRYLSLALRQTVKQRPTLDNLRRANSMSNLLEEENVDIDEVDDRNGDAHNNSTDNPNNSYIHHYNDNNKINSNGMHSATAAIVVSTVKSQMDYDTSYTNGKCEQEPKIDISRRQIQRGNDSLKRARSVEALMRYDTLAWRRDVLEDSEDYPSSNPIILDEIIVSDYQSTVIKAKTADSITIEDKIQQARDRMMDPKPPKRLTSFMSETERPPPDLVKQTLLKFEASANKRTRTIQRYGNGDVAAKVATYKSKLSQDKSPPTVAAVSVSPPIVKLPPSGFGMKKPLIKPRTTSPKPAFLNGIKDNPLSKKPIYTKSIELDTTIEHAQNFNGNGLKSTNDPIVERMNQKNIPQIRIDPTAYRSKYEMSSPDSSPNEDNSPLPSYVFDMVRRREANHTISPLVSQLAGQTENLVLSTPKLRKSEIAFNTTDDSSRQNSSDNDELDDVTSNSSETGWSESYDVNISDNNDDSDVDENFLSSKKPPPIPKHGPKLNGSTVISVQPTLNGNKSLDLHQPEPSVRQIGIIRPLNHDAAVTAAALKPPIPIARKLPSPSTPTSPKKDANDAIKVSVAAAPIVVSTQHSVVLPSSTSSVVVTNSVSVATTNDVQGDVVVIECTGDSNIDGKSTASTMSPLTTPTTTTTNNRTKLINTNNEPNTISIDTRSIVHQKNLLNKEKSEELLNGNSPQTTVIQSPIKWNIKKSTVVSSSPMSPAVNQSPSPQLNQSTKQRPSDIQTTNTMVFNFSNRKDVPDYIENDGLVIRRKRELPKPGESGFVVLGDLTVETSTDPEPDDSWICDPPSPCDVQFKNANVVINGKSSLRDKTKTDPKSIRFNEKLTSTFEYPSESSLCDDIGLNGDNFDDDDTDLLYSNGHFLGSSPIASVPLGNYQPIKIFNTNFELGVTRTHNSSPNQNTSHKYQAPPPPPPRTHSKVPKSVSSPTAISSPDRQSSPQSPQHQQLISVDGSTSATPSSNGGEPESLQYLKPANEDAVAWSEGASDLLF